MAEDVARGLFGRRRQANIVGGRQARFEVKVTDVEAAELRAIAAEQEISVARLLVESALSRGVETITERRQLGFELTEVRRLLASIANNANQVAKYTNTEGVVPAWAADIALDYSQLRPQLNEIVRGLSRS